MTVNMAIDGKNSTFFKAGNEVPYKVTDFLRIFQKAIDKSGR